MEKNLSVAVLGCGNGGVATAADLTIKGCKVNLWEHPDFKENILPIQEAGGIELETVPEIPLTPGFAKLNKATTDLKEAVSGVNLVMVITPSFAHFDIAPQLAEVLEDNQIIVICPGNFGAAIYFRKMFEERGRAKNVLFGEAECMIYACRKKSPTKVFVRRYKKAMKFAALPATQNERLMNIIHKIYPEAIAAVNVLETGLSNPNATQHTPIMILNAGLIDRTKGDFLFYNEGVTPAVMRIIYAADAERIKLCEAFGVKIRSGYEQEVAWYGYQGESGNNLYEAMHDCRFYSTSKAPSSFQDRYLTEDIPYGLAPLEELAKLLGMDTPVASSIINFASLLTEKDLRENRRSFSKLGLEKMSIEEILHMVNG